MAKTKKRRTRTTGAHGRGDTTALTESPVLLERLKGLTTTQIEGLLTADERARHATSHRGVEEVARQYVAVLGHPPTVEHMLAYATAAEAKNEHGVAHNGVAQAWYKAIAERKDATPEHRALLGAFYLRVGWIEEAEKHGVTVDNNAKRRAAATRLRGTYSADRLESPLDLYCEIGDVRGIRAVLRKALTCSDGEAIARKAARALGRTLTHDELLRIGRRRMRGGDIQGTARFIAAHKLHEISQPFITHMLRTGVAWEFIVRWSRRLNAELFIGDIEQYHARMRRKSTCWHDVAASGRALAQRSDRWKRRMPEVYAYCRKQACAWFEAETAERYGKKIGQPLTVSELMRIAEHCKSRSSEHIGGLDWADARRAWCIARAAERIAAAVGNLPEAPAAPERPAEKKRRTAQRAALVESVIQQVMERPAAFDDPMVLKS